MEGKFVLIVLLAWSCQVGISSGTSSGNSKKCWSVDKWQRSTDQWCIDNCLHTPPFCPEEYCKCEEEEANDSTTPKQSQAVDGKWQKWTECDAACGGGKQYRTCEGPFNNGKMCTGNNIKDCNTDLCRIPKCKNDEVATDECICNTKTCNKDDTCKVKDDKCIPKCKNDEVATDECICNTKTCNKYDTCKVKDDKCIRTRKNVANLTDKEKELLQKRLKEVIDIKTPWRNYADIANIHGAPFDIICPDSCCPHGEPAFLPWHRLYMVNMEELLNLPLPYWDWTQSDDVPDLWESISAPFKKLYESPLDQANCLGQTVTHHRRAEASGIKNRFDMVDLNGTTVTALTRNTYDAFWRQIEQAHDELHWAVSCDMGYTDSAAYDPIFYLHHTYVDYLFAYWQALQKERKLPVDLSPDQEEKMKPFDDAKYAYEITRANIKARDVLDYENKLHYKYDELLFDGLTPKEFSEKYDVPMTNTMDGMGRQKRSEKDMDIDIMPDYSKCVFVGIVMPKMAPTSLVEFEICNRQEECIEGGRLVTFGSMRMKPDTKKENDIFNNYNMIEYDVTDAIKKDGRFDTSAIARIKSTNDLVTMSGLEPIMIWRNYLGEQGGEVYLPPGAKRNHYGKFLNKYDEVKEN